MMNWFPRLFLSKLRRAGLFTYWDGRRMRSVDGYRLWRAYVANEFFAKRENLDGLAALGTRKYDDGDAAKQDMELLDRFFDELAKLLGVQRYDPDTGKGLTDTELAAIFCAFEVWVNQKKTPGALLPIFWPTSGRPPSPSTTPPPTSELGSSSTANESPCAE